MDPDHPDGHRRPDVDFEIIHENEILRLDAQTTRCQQIDLASGFAISTSPDKITSSTKTPSPRSRNH